MPNTLPHRDIAGRDLAVDDYVLVCEHNRPILAKIVKLHPFYGGDGRVTVQPLNHTTGGRRPEPNSKPLRRLSYNLFKIADTEITMSILRGYA